MVLRVLIVLLIGCGAARAELSHFFYTLEPHGEHSYYNRPEKNEVAWVYNTPNHDGAIPVYRWMIDNAHHWDTNPRAYSVAPEPNIAFWVLQSPRKDTVPLHCYRDPNTNWIIFSVLPEPQFESLPDLGWVYTSNQNRPYIARLFQFFHDPGPNSHPPPPWKPPTSIDNSGVTLSVIQHGSPEEVTLSIVNTTPKPKYVRFLFEYREGNSWEMKMESSCFYLAAHLTANFDKEQKGAAEWRHTP